MYFFIALFIVSLGGIIFMVGRKLRLLSSGQIIPPEHIPFHVPRFEELQKNASKMARRLGYFILVETIRIYLRLVQFCKIKYEILKTRIAERRRKTGEAPKTKEPNRFLKAVASYKQKIGKIKNEIKEEENL